MKNKKYQTVRTVPKSNRKIVETEALLIPPTDVHDHPLSWLGTDTSIKSGGVKLALWDQKKRISINQSVRKDVDVNGVTIDCHNA